MVMLRWFYGDSKELIRRGGSKGQTSLCETGDKISPANIMENGDLMGLMAFNWN